MHLKKIYFSAFKLECKSYSELNYLIQIKYGIQRRHFQNTQNSKIDISNLFPTANHLTL